MLLTVPSGLHQLATPKLEVMYNSSNQSGKPSLRSPSGSSNSDRKRAAEAAAFAANVSENHQQQSNKRPFSPSSARDDEFAQHALQWRSNLMSASLLGNSSQDLHRLSSYHSSLLNSSLANHHAELAQRQLLSRYFSPQLSLNSLSALGSSTSLNLHQTFPSHASGRASAPGASQSLAALLSLPQNDSFHSSLARFPAASLSQAQAQGQPDMSSILHQAASLPQDRLHEEPRQATAAAVVSASANNGTSEQNPIAASNLSGEGSIPLGIEEDPNWLSDFHVFVRKNLIELCWASSEDVALRSASNRVSSQQVGIRCKCCAHLNPSARAQRSSAFPSSIAQIYQSLTMMLRAHFASCTEVPPALKERFMQLKSKTTQGATDSKQYWIYSARKLGMVDSEEGIVMNSKTTAAATSILPFGSSRDEAAEPPIPMVAPSDRNVSSDFLYTLMLQARRVRLQSSEQRGNKKSLQLGLPGFGCRHCCQLGRMGQCRIFPARRRTLPVKIYDLYEHLQRCSACPKETKELLELLHQREDYQPKSPGHKDFLDLIWSRLVEQA